ncbi:MAG: hypothetical protein RLO21_13755 [Nitratireductor sp.]
MNTLLPIVEQMRDADDDRARAALLLRCPDRVLLEHGEEICTACRRAHFEPGEVFVLLRTTALQAVRHSNGELPDNLARPLEQYREAMARFVARGVGKHEPVVWSTD